MWIRYALSFLIKNIKVYFCTTKIKILFVMAKQNKANEDVLFGDINEKLEHGHEIFEHYKKPVGTALAIILGLAAIFVLYGKFIKGPKERKGAEALAFAENYFQMDSFNIALNGDGKHLGFLKVIQQHVGTKAGKLAHYYAGVCYMQTGKYKEAIAQLEDFSAPEAMVEARRLGLLGDAYMETEQVEKAKEYYQKAVDKAGYNTMLTPDYLYKLAKVKEIKGDKKGAVEAYTALNEEYADTKEGKEALKDKSRLQAQ